MRAFIEKWWPKILVNLYIFYAGFDEKLVMEKYDWMKGICPNDYKLGGIYPGLFTFFSVPSEIGYSFPPDTGSVPIKWGS